MTAPSKDQAATCTECGFAEPYAWAAISREDGVCFRLEDCLQRQRDAAQEELTRLTSLLEEQGRQRDRLAAIIDEAFGMQEYLPTDALLTILERELFQRRTRLAEVERERDEARRQAAALTEGLRLVSDALARLNQIYRSDIDLGDPPVETPAWLQAALEIARRVREEERAACEAIARRCVEERDRQASRFPQHDERRVWIDLKASEAERIADAIRDRAKEQR